MSYKVESAEGKVTVTLESGNVYVLDGSAWAVLAEPAIKAGADPENVLSLMATMTSKSAKKARTEDPIKRAIREFNDLMEKRAEEFGVCPAPSSDNLAAMLAELSAADLVAYSTSPTCWRFKVEGDIAKALNDAKDADEEHYIAQISDYKADMLKGVEIPRGKDGEELTVVFSPGKAPYIKTRGGRRSGQGHGKGKGRKYSFLGETFTSLVELGKVIPGSEEGKSRGYYYSKGLKALESGDATVIAD
ncbi:MAG: hypothetical protein OCU12_06240 [Methanophagales archaeon]|nr:hypothetical protein [Methanophagales archaeon]